MMPPHVCGYEVVLAVAAVGVVAGWGGAVVELIRAGLRGGRV